jgi:hypothetical protein
MTSNFFIINFLELKTKNRLNIDIKDIKSSIKVINEGFSAIEMKANKKKRKINH